MSTTEYDRDVCIMQDAETVLNVIRERGERGLPLENIYRLLYNRNLYLRAYGRIYSNQGATTKGTTAETVDGMSLARIDRCDDVRLGAHHDVGLDPAALGLLLAPLVVKPAVEPARGEVFDTARFPFWKSVLPLAVTVMLLLALAWLYNSRNRHF